MHIGGKYSFPFGLIKTTIAHHGSGSDSGEYMGSPCGVIIKMDNKKIYHCGDTALFIDMAFIGEHYEPHVMLVPIGDNFTMGIDDAVVAVNFVKPKLVLPMHYDTFPIIKADPNEFAEKVGKLEKVDTKVKIMKYGETIDIEL
jgi:L-ascorbate metabolism protein UlaG (beta-lactamase superfamily)